MSARCPVCLQLRKFHCTAASDEMGQRQTLQRGLSAKKRKAAGGGLPLDGLFVPTATACAFRFLPLAVSFPRGSKAVAICEERVLESPADGRKNRPQPHSRTKARLFRRCIPPPTFSTGMPRSVVVTIVPRPTSPCRCRCKPDFQIHQHRYCHQCCAQDRLADHHVCPRYLRDQRTVLLGRPFVKGVVSWASHNVRCCPKADLIRGIASMQRWANSRLNAPQQQ
jgi:hypothetical protein